MNLYYKEFETLTSNYNKNLISKKELLEKRVYLINKFSFAIPTSKALEKISTYSPIIELGAGTGYWAKLLHDKGCDIISLDNGSWDKIWTERYYDVIKGDESVLKDYKNRNLLLCFPMHSNNISLNALKNFEGNYLIYIGELEDTVIEAGDSKEFLLELNKNYKLISETLIPNWPDMCDSVWVFERIQFS